MNFLMWIIGGAMVMMVLFAIFEMAVHYFHARKMKKMMRSGRVMVFNKDTGNYDILK